MKRSHRNCVSTYSNAASISPLKSKDSVEKESTEAVKVGKEMMLTSKEEIKEEIASSDESEIENQTPVKKIKGDDYLKMIEENRQKSLAFLKSLNIDEVKDDFCSSVKALKPVRAKRQNKPREWPPPRKKIERSTKAHLNLSEDALVRKAVKEAKIRSEIEVEKPSKVFPNTFKFRECVLEKDDFSDFKDHFSDLDLEDVPKPILLPDYFKRMKSKKSLFTRVVPETACSMTVHPSANQVIVAAGSKSGRIGFWNVTSNSKCVFECHSHGITDIKFNIYDRHKLLSTSYDGPVLCGDLEKLTFKKYYQADYNVTSCFDILSSSTFIVGHKSGNVAIVDSRTNKNCVKRHSCHEYQIKRVNVHPVDQNYFLSADTKGTIKVWDLRQLKKKPFCATSRHKKGVSSVFYSPETGNSILSTSWDNHCCIFNSSLLTKRLTVEKNIWHNNKVGRSITPFQAVWVPNTNEQFFAVGSLLYPRRVDVFDRQGLIVHQFIDESFNCVLPLISFHPSLPVFVGANSGGKVAVFQDL